MAASLPRLSAIRVGAAAAVVAFALAAWLHHASALHDTDAYFHLAVARIYAEEGIVDQLPQLRYSLLSDGYGDKEFLFHLALAPLLKFLTPLAAGRLALALWAAILAGILAFLAARVLGGWGFFFPFWLFFASTEFAWRVVRLRPELLSLAVLLLAARAMAERRELQLGVLAFLYTLGYTAFQALLGLVFLVFVAFGWREAGFDLRRWPWRMPLFAGIGAGAALIAHPHFPHNLAVWWVQNVVFFGNKGRLEVGSEIRPNTTEVVLLVHLGLLAMVLVLACAARPRPVAAARVEEESEATETSQRYALALGIFAIAFGFLYLGMSRFSVYFWPFATLALLHVGAARGLEIGGSWVFWGRRFPLALGVAAALLLSLPEAWRQLADYHRKTSLGPGEARITDRERMAAALPQGAKVAADWGPTATWMLWAPQGRYLNALDPSFMAFLYPEKEALLERVMDGEEPDVPGRLAAELDSDFLAFPTVGHERLIDRLAGDPRAILRHRGSQQLYQLRPAAELVKDWRLAPAGPGPVPAAQDLTTLPLYPGPATAPGSGPGGYLDGEAAAPGAPCVTLVRDREPGPAEVELAIEGRARVWLDQSLVLEAHGQGARLGHGTLFPLRHPAPARITLSLCAERQGAAKGAYWRERRPEPSAAAPTVQSAKIPS